MLEKISLTYQTMEPMSATIQRILHMESTLFVLARQASDECTRECALGVVMAMRPARAIDHYELRGR